MKTKAFAGMAMLCFLMACNDGLEDVSPDPFFPNQNKFNTTLFVRITSSNGNPLEGVKLKMGALESTSDPDGWVMWYNVQVGSSVFLRAEKKGYFSSSRRCYPSPDGVPQYVRLIMESSDATRSFDGTHGGRISLPDQFNLDFPADVYEDENGKDYHGIVLLALQPLSIDDPMMSYKMPGDLTGINQDGVAGQLTTMGMIRVEMRDIEGNPLHLKSGSSVNIEFPVSDSRLALVPSTMPLWYFDEDKGVWKEEGEATLIDHHYIGAVHHFSFWNCDEWNTAVDWSTTLRHEDGTTVKFGQVCLTINRIESKRCCYVDQNGKAYGRVPGQEPMTIEVYNECNDLEYSGLVGPYSENAVEGPYILTRPDDQVTISGHAYSCDLTPLQNGRVLLTYNDLIYQPDIHADGSFSIDLVGCQVATLSLRIFDLDNGLNSVMQYFDPSPSIIVDSLMACQSSDEYLFLKLENQESPLYTERIEYHVSGQDCLSFIDSKGAQHNFWVCMKDNKPGDYPETSGYLSLQLSELKSAECTYFDMHVDEYGDIGDYIKASMRGNVQIRFGDSTMTTVPFTGEFRVRRD